MANKIVHIALTVDDIIDQALAFYTDQLGFALVANKTLAPGIRWVAVAPSESNETIIIF